MNTSVANTVDTDVVIVGGGDTALDWALQLEPIARSVTVIHRRRTFRAHAASLHRAADLGVRLLATRPELKLGVVTALVGAPFLIVLLLRNRGRA